MINRVSIKVGGASGTGINTVGTILAKAFKRASLYNFGYREYPSLIKGGYASYKLEISDTPINSVSNNTNILVAIDKGSFDVHLNEATNGQIFIYDKSAIRVSEDDQVKLNQSGARVIELMLGNTIKELGAAPIMKNTVLLGAIWNLLNLEREILIQAILDVFNKTQEIEELNKKCAETGFTLIQSDTTLLQNFNRKDNLMDSIIISGNESIALGAVAGGVRAYFAYPMTPSSTVLHSIVKYAQGNGVIVKQAEDEITAVNMTVGANFAGTRAMTGTSGGGFDLMSEAVSLAGITETPLPIVLAQRPGPATGLPTWTTQGDLKLAIYAGHGEFPRIVIAAGDPEECFYLTTEALNLAEKYQTVVIILTDKLLAESLYTAPAFDSSKVKVERGELYFEMTDKEQDRYQYTESGISARWIPGIDAKTYLANSDEHDTYGNSIEDAETTKLMMDKRDRKMIGIMNELPEPEVFGSESAEVSFVCWGSTKHFIVDAMKYLEDQGIKSNMLYYKYVFPLKTDKLKEFVQKAKNVILVENNQTGQLGEIIEMKTDVRFKNKLLKYDGRPFWIEEIVEATKKIISNT